MNIKPGGYPDSINLKSKGVTPVAIFGTQTLDVAQIDFTTVTLANAPIKLKKNGQLMVSYENVNEDGIIDVIIHIATKELQLTTNDIKADLRGFLLNSREIKGFDFVHIVP